MLYFLGIWLFFGVMAASYAIYKGYPRPLSFLGVVFGPISLLLVVCLPVIGEGRTRVESDLQADCELYESKSSIICPQCGRENSVTTRVCPRCERRFPRTDAGKDKRP